MVNEAGVLTARDIRVCTLYMLLASAMWIVNKKTITYLPVPFFVTLVQALATCAILKMAQRLKAIQMQPFSWETFGEWVNTGIVWAVPLALNLRALTRLNPETLIVFRTATLIGVTFGDYAYYGKEQRTLPLPPFLPDSPIIHAASDQNHFIYLRHACNSTYV